MMSNQDRRVPAVTGHSGVPCRLCGFQGGSLDIKTCVSPGIFLLLMKSRFVFFYTYPTQNCNY